MAGGSNPKVAGGGMPPGQRGPGGPSSEDLSTAASVLTSISNSVPVAYTPTTHRVSKAKKGKKVHVCEFGCGKVFSRAEHRRRHEANHRSEPLYRCNQPGCDKTFQRPDLLTRHLERQHGVHAPPGQVMRPEHEPAGNKNGSGDIGVDLNSPTSTDLDAYGDEIRDLYLRQKRPLQAIKSYMETKHGVAPLDDQVYEQAFARLCLTKGTSPIPTAQMGRATRGQAMQPVSEWDMARYNQEQINTAQSAHAHMQLMNAAGLRDELMHPANLGRYDASRHFGAGDDSKDDSNRIPLDPLLAGRQLDCPAPDCDRRGTEGFETREVLWDHMVAKHGMTGAGR